MRRPAALALFLALGAASAFAAEAPALPRDPLGIPIPSDPSVADLISTGAESGDLQGVIPAAGACRSAPQRTISLPADDRPHNDAYLEWWWWRGGMTTPDGRRFAYMVTFAGKPWSRTYAADYTVTDLSNGTFHYAREPVILGRPVATRNGVKLRGDQVRAAGGDGHDRLRFQVDGYRFSLSIERTKPPVIQLDDGYLNAYCNAVYLYSRVRMRVTGTVKQAGKTATIVGTSTFDHQWGFGPATEIAHWNWMTFGLDDGRDLFLLVVRARQDGDEAVLYTGSISNADGSFTTLHRGDFTIVPTRHWRRDATCTYPVEWDVHVKGLRLHIRPSLDKTEVRAIRSPASYTLWPVYWDGETTITGDATGRGWLDMKGCHV